MTILREFSSNFIKLKRTPLLLLHLLLPIVITFLFLYYYTISGYRIITDVRVFFIILQICYPTFVGIVVSAFTQLDRNINGMQNTLGLVESRISIYLGKLFFILFLSAINLILYELCFYIGVNLFLDTNVAPLNSYIGIFPIFLFSNLFLYSLHLSVAFRFGSSVSVLLGIAGTILAGYFQTAIGDKIWPIIPWECSVRFLENYFNFSSSSIISGIISMIILTSIVLILSILWFNRWEGKITQE
ncbi:lantibiotic immunity ABC transporter MutG family permease subunit [Clostridium lundense]|uniref:lantibiotic immunity ABC transporter MutG family permease subunit n=1 Tax=Clostridium lundense TaxID=319475 RepID=UPI00048208A0|nr:lantibiotic immunity ABC transporter MutG family permease subunit [Clostridium lundense]